MVFRSTAARLSSNSKFAIKPWLARQYRDPDVKQYLGRPTAYRSRSAFTLLQINDDYDHFLDKPYVNTVIDLGAYPGSWSQVVAGKLGWTPEPRKGPSPAKETQTDTGVSNAEESGWSDYAPPLVLTSDAKAKEMSLDVEHSGSAKLSNPLPAPRAQDRGTIIAVDTVRIPPIRGVQTVRTDFKLESTTHLIQGLLCSAENPQGKADIILSDLAAQSYEESVDNIEPTLAMCQDLLDFATLNLRPAKSIGKWTGGVLLMKAFMHPVIRRFRNEKLKPNFHRVHFVKPKSRHIPESDGYFICQGYHPK